MKPSATLATLLTRFFSQRLMQQRHASPHTISSYRDTFRLLLQFAKSRLGKEPSQLSWDEMDAPLISFPTPRAGQAFAQKRRCAIKRTAAPT